jgi:long-subunit acyl-CoA synthetase (AMP-forming)
LVVPFSLLSSHSTAFELNHALRISDVTRLFVHPRLLPQALIVAHEVGIPDDHIYILEGRVPGRQSLDDMIDRVQKSRLPRLGVRHAEKDALAYLIFSSGTSGLPKGAGHFTMWTSLTYFHSGHDLARKYDLFHGSVTYRFARMGQSICSAYFGFQSF